MKPMTRWRRASASSWPACFAPENGCGACKPISAVLERKYLAIDLNDVKDGLLPEGASRGLDPGA